MLSHLSVVQPLCSTDVAGQAAWDRSLVYSAWPQEQKRFPLTKACGYWPGQYRSIAGLVMSLDIFLSAQHWFHLEHP